jgi:hypothetical protein
MNWLRSRRFYAGVGIGLIPMLLLAAQTNDPLTTDRRDGHPVVVRTYAGCCPDSTDADRTAALLEALPKDVVLVETFTGCCCGDTTRVYGPTSSRDVFVPPSPITGTGPGRGYPPAFAPTPDAPSVPRNEVPGIAAVQPEAPPVAGLTPVNVPLPPPPAQAGLPGWLGFLVAPLALLAGEFGSSDGTICPDDSGLPVGPNRARC